MVRLRHRVGRQRVRLGLCTARLSVESVAQCGRTSERSRWKEAVCVAPRLAALGLVEPGERVEGSGLLAKAGHVDEAPAVDAGEPGFPEVPRALLEPAWWHVAKFGKWTFDEDILIREARALGYGLRRAANAVPGHSRRLLFLVDNISMCLSFGRGRAKRFELLVQVRKWHAYAFARNLRCAVRCVPSELNSSDAPS